MLENRRIRAPFAIVLALVAGCSDAGTPPPDAGSTLPDAGSTLPDGGTSENGKGTFAASWSIVLGGETKDCFAVGAGFVSLSLSRAGSQDPMVLDFACEDGAGKTGEIAAGAYTIAASLLDNNKKPMLALPPSTATIAADGDEVKLPDLSFDLPSARFTAGWKLTKMNGPATCAEFGAARAEILANNLQTGLGFGVTVECEDGKGTTPPIPLGDYGVVISLLYEQDVVLVSADEVTASLTKAGETVVLPDVTFTLP